MCVKLVSASDVREYDVDRPLEEQIKDCERIVVNYQPFDTQVDRLLQEMQRFALTGISTNVKIQVIHNDNLLGYKTKKKLQKASNDITLNEIIKLMVLSHAALDKKLEEISNVLGQR